MTDLYSVLSDIGRHPQMYSISTMGELRSFVDGYRFAISRANTISHEVPPFHQFTEWLVLKLKRGDTSFGWWQLIHWNGLDDAEAIRDFGQLITEFSKRLPTIWADVQPNPECHSATGRFQYGGSDGNGVFDLTYTLPSEIRIAKYATDDGVYLEYKFDQTHYERYCPSVAVAMRDAYAEFHIKECDWKLRS